MAEDKNQKENSAGENNDKKQSFSDALGPENSKSADEGKDKEKSEKPEKKEEKSKLKVKPKAFESEKTEEEIQTEKLKKKVSYSFSALLKNLYAMLADILDIRSTSNVEATNKEILADIEFRGANVWALVASIIIASIGLNIDSAAVVIGAMLISPLMGPIIGTGWSMAVNDIDALKKSMKNFMVMVTLGILTSMIYFLISPLRSPSAELIGRTSPTILDLFIAFFGGIAGIVSISKSGKINVILGVAIATALIPPLCTAGYGLAEGRLDFFAGASYLFLINSVFIALASFIMIRYLRFPLKKYLDPSRDKKVKRLLIIFGTLVMIPSAYTFYNSIMLFRFETEAERFVEREINPKGSKVLKVESTKGDSINLIEVYLIGSGVDSLTLAKWNRKLESYNLKNTELKVYQDRDMSVVEIADNLHYQVKTDILEDLYRNNSEALESKEKQIRYLEKRLSSYQSKSLPLAEISPEAETIFPDIRNIAVGESYALGDSGRVDTVSTVLIIWKDQKIKEKKKSGIRQRLGSWLKVKLKRDSVLIFDIN